MSNVFVSLDSGVFHFSTLCLLFYLFFFFNLSFLNLKTKPMKCFLKMKFSLKYKKDKYAPRSPMKYQTVWLQQRIKINKPKL